MNYVERKAILFCKKKKGKQLKEKYPQFIVDFVSTDVKILEIVKRLESEYVGKKKRTKRVQMYPKNTPLKFIIQPTFFREKFKHESTNFDMFSEDEQEEDFGYKTKSSHYLENTSFQKLKIVQKFLAKNRHKKMR